MPQQRHRLSAAFVALVLLGGCAVPTPETPEEAQMRRGLSCTEAGFAPDSENHRLCVLLQQTNERLAAVERRLSFIEQDVRLPPLGPSRYWW